MAVHKINKEVLLEICKAIAEGSTLYEISKNQDITYVKLLTKLRQMTPNEYRDAKIADSKRRLKQLKTAEDKLINGFETVSEKTEFLIGKDGIPRPSKIVREKTFIPPAASTVNMHRKRQWEQKDKQQQTGTGEVVWNETKTYELPKTESVEIEQTEE